MAEIRRIRIPMYYPNTTDICAHLLKLGYSVRLGDECTNLSEEEIAETVIEYRRGEL